MQAPQGERRGEEPRAAIARRLGSPRPELHARQEQRAARGQTGEAARGDTRVRHVAEGGGGDQHAGGSDQQIAAPDPVVKAKGQTGGQDEEGRAEENGTDQGAQDLGAGNEGASQVQAFRHAHQAPRREQVLKEPHAVGRIEIGEDQELDRQRDRGGEG
jgi:hypothetical protein